jgi:Mrp family chromosome partitioning ATPase
MQRPDTTAWSDSVLRARATVAQAEAEVAAARDSLAVALASTRDTLRPELRARRDSISSALAAINRLLLRTENAPLPASYRALAQSPLLRGNTRVIALVDSLTAVERERQHFGAAGGVDTTFVALTARAGAIGRAISGIAYRERNRMREELAELRQTQPQRDTLSPSIIVRFNEIHLDSVHAELEDVEEKLAALRLVHLRLDSASVRARDSARAAAPPIAMLAASAVLALVAGFGATLMRELLRPTIANSHEAEKVTGFRVIAVITPSRTERDDSSAARPSLIDLEADSYRRLYLYLAGSRASLAMVTVTGDEPGLHAVVAANIAAAAGKEGRGTLLVDGDLERSPIAAIFGAPSTPGLADILDRRAGWPEALEPIAIERDFSLDLVPAGNRGAAGSVLDQDAERIRHDLGRMARRYDVMVLNAPLAHVQRGAGSMLPAPDVLLCMRVGRTKIRQLRQSLDSLRAAGTRITGLVLWVRDDPRIPTSVPTTNNATHRTPVVPPVSTLS